ncbi:MAG TPA: hypothetical protein VHO92_02695 [Methanobacterium sp.]|nr:hypothetical protein [Methanobacterium sp.]
MSKEDFLKQLHEDTLKRLVHVFSLEDKLPMWPERKDYINILANSRKATIKNIKAVLKM